MDDDDVPVTGKRLVVNRVENVVSSISGANSSEFDKYRRARRREQERLDAIEKERREAEERDSLFLRVQLNKLEAEERTRRNAEKRLRKKLRKRQRAAGRESAVVCACEGAIQLFFGSCYYSFRRLHSQELSGLGTNVFK